jgi:hypothetical protein
MQHFLENTSNENGEFVVVQDRQLRPGNSDARPEGALTTVSEACYAKMTTGVPPT